MKGNYMGTEWHSNVNQLHCLTSNFTFSKVNGRPSSFLNGRVVLRIFSKTIYTSQKQFLSHKFKHKLSSLECVVLNVHRV